MFSIPTDHPEGLDQALLILKDWLCGITIAPEEVEGEKGIILEEELAMHDQAAGIVDEHDQVGLPVFSPA